MHNGSVLLRVDATVTSVRIKLSAAFPPASLFFFHLARQKNARLSDSAVFPLNNFESDREYPRDPGGTIELKYAAWKRARAVVRNIIFTNRELGISHFQYHLVDIVTYIIN